MKGADAYSEAFSDTIRKVAEDAAANRRPAADAKAKPLLPLLMFDEIKPVLDVRDFVQGVLTEGGAAVVYGESNAGKTFWTTDLGLHVAAGKDWNGRRVEQGGVVYCVLEGGIGFRNRVVGWREAHGYEDARIPFAAISASLNLLDPAADAPRVIAAIQAASEHLGVPVKLVVIDTLSRAMAGGNENAPDDMGALVRNMDAIRQETGACVLLVHHCGKDAAKGARGHSLLRGALDTEIEVRSDDDTGAKVATVVKQREMRKGDAFGFRLEAMTLGQNRHGEDVTTCVVQGSDEAPRKRSKPLHAEAESLRREINNIFAAGKGQSRRPEPGMPEVPTISRNTLRDVLVRKGWIRLPDEVSSGVSGAEPIPKSEHTRLWKRLELLKSQGIIGFNRHDVWLTERGDFP